jgi:CheY-like chemotaxis protein
MARLLEDLLDVSRISSGKLELRRQRIELAAVIEAALETSRPVIDAGGHQLSVTLPDEPVWLYADPIRLAQVFANLLNNAAKYTENDGRIWLTAAREGGEIVVTVRDRGIGIAGEVLPRLFTIFAQAEPALSRSQGGLGIGLSLVKGLVDLHGGRVEACSAGPGTGSEFVVRLPIDTRAPAAEPPGEEAGVGEPMRILVADDNHDSADSLVMLLESMGHVAVAAYDGVQALERGAVMQPEVMLLDIGMPALNGYEVARRVRASDWGRDTVLVAITGWGQDEDRRRTRAAGFDVHVVKPVDATLLMRRIAAVRERRTSTAG